MGTVCVGEGEGEGGGGGGSAAGNVGLCVSCWRVTGALVKQSLLRLVGLVALLGACEADYQDPSLLCMHCCRGFEQYIWLCVRSTQACLSPHLSSYRNPVRNIRVLMPNMEPGALFNPPFLRMLAPFDTLRYVHLRVRACVCAAAEPRVSSSNDLFLWPRPFPPARQPYVCLAGGSAPTGAHCLSLVPCPIARLFVDPNWVQIFLCGSPLPYATGSWTGSTPTKTSAGPTPCLGSSPTT